VQWLRAGSRWVLFTNPLDSNAPTITLSENRDGAWERTFFRGNSSTVDRRHHASLEEAQRAATEDAAAYLRRDR
jgi:hypothetical protein